MERYIQERLSDAERDSFEAHLAECQECANELTRLGTLRAELMRQRDRIEAAETASPKPAWTRYLALAAMLVLAALSVFLLRPEPKAGLETLVVLEAPTHEATRLRGISDEADEVFRDGMALYESGDFEGAITALSRAAAEDENRTDAPFFLGASLLLSGKPAASSGHLSAVVASADVQYLEEALYLRAQAHLLLGDAEAARTDLRSIIELGGGWRQRASDQLDRLEAWLANH